MAEIDILLNEYNNLWEEKIAHKQSLRKLKGYVSYLTSLLSLSLTFLGLSATDIFNKVANGAAKDTANGGAATVTLIDNVYSIFMLISIPFTPIVILVGSFAINDLYQIYVIGNHIGNIEKKINRLSSTESLLTWEHLVCPVAFGGGKVNGSSFKNIIEWSDKRIFFPFILSLCIVTTIWSGVFLFIENIFFFILYAAIILYLIISISKIGKRLYEYTKAGSELTTSIASLSEVPKSENCITVAGPD